MIINEIFYSIQGEGSLAGFPSVFIRLAGCPLRCKWCDTKYAWAPDAGKEYSIEELFTELAEYPAHHIVITGGEPFACAELAELCNALKSNDVHVTIETAGTIFTDDLKCELVSISPKLGNSAPADAKLAAEHNANCFDLDALQSLISNYNYQLKFVVDSPEDLDEIAQCLQKLNNINPDKVYLMPQATTQSEHLEKSQFIVEICKRAGFPFSPRLQVMLYNNEKGK